MENVRPGAERRKEQRTFFAGPATVKIMGRAADALEMNVPADAEIIDISASGIRLRTLRPIPLGTSVEINCGEAMLHGEIRRCAPERSTFKNGPYVVGVLVRRAMAARDELKQFAQRLNEQRR